MKEDMDEGSKGRLAGIEENGEMEFYLADSIWLGQD